MMMESVTINRSANKMMMMVIMMVTISIMMMLTSISMTLLIPSKILMQIMMTTPSFRCHQHLTGESFPPVPHPTAIKVSIVALESISPSY